MSKWIFHVYHNTIRALKLFKRSISCNSNGFHFIGEYFNGQHFIRQYTLKYPPLKCPPLTFPILKSPPLICPPLKCPPLICPPLITLFGIIVPNFGTSMPRYPWNYTEIGSFFKIFWNWLPNTGFFINLKFVNHDPKVGTYMLKFELLGLNHINKTSSNW